MVRDASDLRRTAGAGFRDRGVWSINQPPWQRPPRRRLYTPIRRIHRSKVEYPPRSFHPQTAGQHCCTAVQLGAFLAGMALARAENSGQHGLISRPNN